MGNAMMDQYIIGESFRPIHSQQKKQIYPLFNPITKPVPTNAGNDATDKINVWRLINPKPKIIMKIKNRSL